MADLFTWVGRAAHGGHAPRRCRDGYPIPDVGRTTVHVVLVGFRFIVGKSRYRAHTGSQREESGESQFLGSLWRATLSREAWMPIWGLSTESMKPWPPPGDG